MKNIDLEKLEGVDVEFSKDAFTSKGTTYCGKDNRKMKLVAKNYPLSGGITLTIKVFRCPKCKRELLGFDEAQKLDTALEVKRALEKTSFSFTRKLSFDGDNFTLRLPKELTKGLKKRQVAITPLAKRKVMMEW
ncbi:MAG: hypothetical protein OXR66_03735 [Candidatus Woesearchaeota archaeon]|nr:hypothetical protein [Candidatus Woesearchaeota archaeon]